MRSDESNQNAQTVDYTLVIMAKAPRDGLVKTRLAHSLPVEAVTALYRCFLSDTLTLAHSLPDVNIAIVSPASDVEDMASFVGRHAKVVAQQGDGLAAALTSVFAHFASSGSGRVIAFNSDTPHLPASILASAFQILADHDVVVGPTYDGGYYLVGAKEPCGTLFHSDRLGTTSALDTLLARARILQYSVGFTDAFYDIDVVDDLSRLAGELKVAPGRAPRTAAWLQQHQDLLHQSQSATGAP